MPAIIFGLFILGVQTFIHAPEQGWNSKDEFVVSVEKAMNESVSVKTQIEYDARYND